jgi:transcriptional regulator with XRE-family HTH domain
MKRTARAPERNHLTTGSPAKPVHSYGRGSGVPHPVDVDVGKHIRARRLFLGMNQAALAAALGLTFQQVQKYEHGANRVSASRLSAIADVLGVPVSFFFIEGPVHHDARMEQSETIELVRCYYAIPDARVRQQFLQMIKAAARRSKRRAPERDAEPLTSSAPAAAGD